MSNELSFLLGKLQGTAEAMTDMKLAKVYENEKAAAVEAAREECAKVAEEIKTISASAPGGLRDPRTVALVIAEEIRTLNVTRALDQALVQRTKQVFDYCVEHLRTKEPEGEGCSCGLCDVREELLARAQSE